MDLRACYPGQPNITRKNLRGKGRPCTTQTEFAALTVKDQCYGGCLPSHKLVQSGWFVFQNFLHRIGPIFGISTWRGGNLNLRRLCNPPIQPLLQKLKPREFELPKVTQLVRVRGTRTRLLHALLPGLCVCVRACVRGAGGERKDRDRGRGRDRLRFRPTESVPVSCASDSVQRTVSTSWSWNPSGCRRSLSLHRQHPQSQIIYLRFNEHQTLRPGTWKPRKFQFQAHTL